jgi:hypothetical protein
MIFRHLTRLFLFQLLFFLTDNHVPMGTAAVFVVFFASMLFWISQLKALRVFVERHVKDVRRATPCDAILCRVFT